jgi:hypothetical protein
MPLKNQLHIDKLLSNISVAYRNKSYVAMEIFPEVKVQNDSDLYRIYERNFRVPHSARSPKAVANEWDFNVTTASYLLERHSLRQFVSDTEARNYDISDLRADATENLTDAILRRMEKSAASLITTTSWSLSISLTSIAAWNATTTVDPVAHYDTAQSTLVLNSGYKGNLSAMGRSAWVALKNNAQIIDRVKYTSQEISENVVAALVGVEKILVSEQVEDTAHEGASGGSVITAMWNDAVYLGYRAPNPGPMVPSAGYVFRSSIPMVKRYREEDRESDVIEVDMEYQIKVVASLAGLIIKDVV